MQVMQTSCRSYMCEWRTTTFLRISILRENSAFRKIEKFISEISPNLNIEKSLDDFISRNDIFSNNFRLASAKFVYLRIFLQF